MRFFAPLLLLATTAFAIYPEGHFGRSTKMTVDNFDDVVKENVDAGKTLMAPAWNAVTEFYEDHNDVAFADVNLREARIRGHHNPGQGGWPTIRYFNKETGYEGASYVKKTGRSMCDELGDVETLKAYVDDALAIGQTSSKCLIDDESTCEEQELAYLAKWSSKGQGDLESQIRRLILMKESKMAPNLKLWVGQRLNILEQIQEVHEASAGSPGHDEL